MECRIAERNKRSAETFYDVRCFNGDHYIIETENCDFQCLIK